MPAALLLGLSLVSSTARADTETVRLANGSAFEGELVEKIPGDHVTIKLATGEVRRFDWSELSTPQTQTSLAHAAAAQLGPAPLPPRPAHLRFESDEKGAILMRVDQVPTNTGVYPYTTETVTPVCYAPCAADVDANARYFVEGAHVTGSARFAIPDGSSTVTARTGSSAATIASAWMLVTGILSTTVGAVVTPIAFSDAGTQNGLNGWEQYGLGMLAGGGALVLVAIPLLIAGRTHVGIGDMDVARGTIHWIPGGFTF